MHGGVERVDGTVRRPVHERSAFVAALLTRLRAAGFDGAPLPLGFDDRGRQVLEWIDGEVPGSSPFHLSGEPLDTAARLVRAFHDAAATMPGLGAHETVEHGDLGPHNTVFRAGLPVALIDWDDCVRPGSRIVDFAQGVWGFADLLEPEVDPVQQRDGLHRMCAAYGDVTPDEVLDELHARFSRALQDHAAHGRDRAVAVFQDLDRRLAMQRRGLLRPA